LEVETVWQIKEFKFSYFLRRMWLLPVGLQERETLIYTKYGGDSVFLMMTGLSLAGSMSPLLIFRQTLRVIVNQDLAACFV